MADFTQETRTVSVTLTEFKLPNPTNYAELTKALRAAIGVVKRLNDDYPLWDDDITVSADEEGVYLVVDHSRFAKA
jgi:hypothetical protein